MARPTFVAWERIALTEREAIDALLDLAPTCTELAIAGSPPGVIADGEWDVTDEVLAGCLSMARLTARYREALEAIARSHGGKHNAAATARKALDEASWREHQQR
jgi:hypothetical protein